MMASVPALGGATFDGSVAVRELPPRGMITIRGDLTRAALRNAATEIAGVDFPARGKAAVAGGKGILWMSPDEILVLCPRSEAGAAAADAQRALGGAHSLVADVSDARSIFALEGEAAAVREVLAKLAPADLHPESFPPGILRRTRLAQVPAAFWLRDEGAAEVIAFRSVARYVFGLLKTAATGTPVGHF